MDNMVLGQFKDLGLGLVLALSALGSGAGAGVAGMAAIGAWKKNMAQNKAASFMMIAFVGAAPNADHIRYDSYEQDV